MIPKDDHLDPEIVQLDRPSGQYFYDERSVQKMVVYCESKKQDVATENVHF